MSRRGGWPGRPPLAGRTQVRSSWPPTATVRTLAVVNISPRRRGERRIALAARLSPAVMLAATALGQPAGVVRPPAAADLLRPGEPVARVGGVAGGGLECRFRIAGRVDHGGDVPAGGQDERDWSAEQLGAAVAGLPGAQVVGDPGD